MLLLLLTPCACIYCWLHSALTVCRYDAPRPSQEDGGCALHSPEPCLSSQICCCWTSPLTTWTFTLFYGWRYVLQGRTQVLHLMPISTLYYAACYSMQLHHIRIACHVYSANQPVTAQHLRLCCSSQLCCCCGTALGRFHVQLWCWNAMPRSFMALQQLAVHHPLFKFWDQGVTICMDTLHMTEHLSVSRW